VCKLRKRTKLPPLREIANIPMALIPEDGKYAAFIMKSIDDIKSGDICKEGDILLAGITPSFENGKQGIVPQLPSKYAITSTEAFPIICDSDVETHFIFHLLKYEFTRRIIASRMEGSTGRQRVPSDVLMNFHIPVPPLVEQRGIVEVLGTVDECIRLTDVVIERAEELKRGLMQRLLARGIGHTEYKETDVGLIPSNWEDTIINKYCYVTKLAGFEYTKHIKYKEKGEIIALRGTNLSDHGLDLSEVRYIDKETSDFLTRSKLYKNDVIMTFIGVNIGDVVIIPESDKYHCAPNIAKITVKDEAILNPLFLLWYLKSYNAQKHIKRLTKSTAKQSINMSEIRTVKLLLPPKKEQDMIVDILNKSQSQINSEFKKHLILKNLKAGLMNLLLSGRVRVELKGDGLQRIGDGREANN